MNNNKIKGISSLYGKLNCFFHEGELIHKVVFNLLPVTELPLIFQLVIEESCIDAMDLVLSHSQPHFRSIAAESLTCCCLYNKHPHIRQNVTFLFGIQKG